AAVFGRRDWLDAAIANAEFLLRELRDDNGRWMRSWQADGQPKARHMALAADHAALVDAFTRLAEATGEARWIDEARAVARALIERFWDVERGGLYTTGRDAEPLVTRPKDLMDNATPSANSLAALAFLRLGALTGDERLTAHAEAILRLLGPVAGQHPTAFGHLLGALDLAVHGPVELVVAGDRADLVAVARRDHRPELVLAWGERYDSPLWAGRDDGRAYVCRRYACQLPADDPAELLVQLDAAAHP
ncbi:MAG TPA: hypothetical protein VK866_18970, partial [Acidimicrobiales bacterium]|nr:hypothetical protein [Acidimicrobiales bacterium]